MKIQIRRFTDLEAWKFAHELRINVLLEVKNFPDEYRYGLSSQMQRAAISVGSNLAEGFGRYSQKERIQFYRIARASLIELQDQMIVAHDISLISRLKFDELDNQAISTLKLINGLIRSTPRMYANSKLQPPTSNV